MNQNYSILKTFVWVSIFGIAMALLEADVVVYLRQLYYPEGFKEPLTVIPKFTLLVELGRELATIVMLLAVGIIAGKNFQQRFAYFSFLFGVWDIFYYVWLKLILNWPSSILEWDILFLIPLPWVGPVIAPIIVSLCLIIGAIFILFFQEKGRPVDINKHDWIVLILAGFIIIMSFVCDSSFVLKQHFPLKYNWNILFIGLFIGITRFALIIKKKL